ncbi:MAG: ROK family protein [Syntrophobacteraceae bacterium]|nr:ROK family protein [Syntrophobacteraceae bacterium]
MKDKRFIGIDLGGTHLRSALVDGGGTILEHRKIGIGSVEDPRNLSLRLINECRLLLEESQRTNRKVEAVGMGVAGKIDSRRGTVIFSPNLPTVRNYPLGLELQEALGIPVFMENDANAFGVGEGWVGAARGIPNWVGLTLGTGVGGCLLFDGRLWQGDHLGFSGEIGHMIVDPHGPRCGCGLQGCLEAHASGSALMRGIEEAIEKGHGVSPPLRKDWEQGRLNPERIHQYARTGEPAARELFRRMGWALGLALASLFTVLGVRHAILGGGVSASWDQFHGFLLESLSRYSSMLDPKDAVVRRSELGDRAALLGAARLAWERYNQESRGSRVQGREA